MRQHFVFIYDRQFTLMWIAELAFIYIRGVLSWGYLHFLAISNGSYPTPCLYQADGTFL